MNNKIKLWNSNIPYYKENTDMGEPYIKEFFLDGENNSCVLVIPGGGYTCVCADVEGENVCRYLNSEGISAACLFYRTGPCYRHPVMETDARRAIKLLKFNSDKWGLDPEKIGVIGFSAGGHLAAMTALRFDYGVNGGDEADKLSSKPSTAAISYGVCSLDPEITHKGSFETLLGENADENLIKSLSAENIIRDDAPPFFLWHTAQDTTVNPFCTLRFAGELIKNEIPCELHIFPYGPHGMALAENDRLVSSWPKLYVKWLKYYGY